MPSYSGVWALTAQFQAKGAGNWPNSQFVGDIAIFAGGSSTNVIQYVSISSTGNATDFGDLIADTNTNPAATSNSHGGLS